MKRGGVVKHGHTIGHKPTPEYRAWAQMMTRCNNPNADKYAYYGGRGIKVCDRWQKFENFLADMGVKPSKGHSVERKNNDGDYCPENCRWATKKEQSSNRRSNTLVTYQGRTQTLKQWAEEIGMKYATLHARISIRGWSVERSFTEPVEGT